MRTYGDDDLKAQLPEAEKDTGIYFATADKKFASNSQALKVTNINARDIDVKVKVEVTSDDYDDMTFAESGTWEATDKDNEIYLAVAEKDADPANVAVVAADKAAELTIQVAGKPTNYGVSRTVDSDGNATYAYAQKTGSDLTWNETEFYLTGAINKNAEWKDGTVTVPDIKVTWDYAAHVDGPQISVTNTAVVISGLSDGQTVTQVQAAQGSKVATVENGNNCTVTSSNGTVTFAMNNAWKEFFGTSTAVTFSTRVGDTTLSKTYTFTE